MENCNDIYDIYVERILDVKTCFQDGVENVYYMVQWKCTWESEKSLTKHCSSFLNRFHKQRDEEQRKYFQYALEGKIDKKTKHKGSTTSCETADSLESEDAEDISYLKCHENYDFETDLPSNSCEKSLEDNEAEATNVFKNPENCEGPVGDIPAIYVEDDKDDDEPDFVNDIGDIDLLSDVSVGIHDSDNMNCPIPNIPFRETVSSNHENTEKDLDDNECHDFATVAYTNTNDDSKLLADQTVNNNEKNNSFIGDSESCYNRAVLSEITVKSVPVVMLTDVSTKVVLPSFDVNENLISSDQEQDSNVFEGCNEERIEGKKLYKCERCRYASPFIGNFKRHMQTKICRRRAQNMNSGIGNVRKAIQDKTISTTSKLFKCKICPYTTNFRRDFRKHSQRHFKEPKNTLRFQCNSCDFSTKHRSSLRRHRLTFHKSKELDKKPKEDKPSQKKVQPAIYKCNKCNFQSSYAHNLKKHLKTKKHDRNHAVIDKKLNTWTKVPNVKPQNQLIKKRSNEMESSYSNKTTGYKLKNYRCEFCKYCTPRRHLYKWHMKAKHPNVNKKSQKILKTNELQCNIIDNRSRTIAYLLSWKALKLKGFICQYCYIERRSRVELENHLRLHTQEKPFVCSICNVSFQQKRQVLKHLKTHGSKLEYVRRKFVDKGSCRKRQSVFDRKIIKNILCSEKLDIELETSDIDCEVDFSNSNQDPEKKQECYVNISNLNCNPGDIGGTNIKKTVNNFQISVVNENSFVENEQPVNNNQQNSFVENDDLNPTVSNDAQEVLINCQQCSFSTNSERNLEIHSIIHTLEKIFKCRYCDIYYETKAIRLQHERDIHGVGDIQNNSVQCRYCIYTGSSYYLKQHEKTHVKAFSCPYCSYKGARKDYVKVHVAKRHKNSRYSVL